MERMESEIPSPSERSMAALAHASGIFFPLLGPLCFWLFAPKSRFVRFHALHALIGALLLNLLLFTLAAISIAISIVGLYRQYREGWQDFSLWQIVIKSAVTWVVFALIGLANTVMNVMQALAAQRGEMPARGIATKIVNCLMGRRPAPAF